MLCFAKGNPNAEGSTDSTQIECVAGKEQGTNNGWAREGPKAVLAVGVGHATVRPRSAIASLVPSRNATLIFPSGRPKLLFR